MESLLQQFQDLPASVREIVRVSIWFLTLMIIFVPLERLFAVRPQKIFRKSFLTNAGYYFLNSILLRWLLVVPLAAIAWALRHVVPGALHSWVALMPLWARLAAALVVGEFGFYWGHRWMHEIPLLWRFHSIHHSAEQVDWLVNTRAHPLDIVFGRLSGFVPMYALGLAQPMAGQHLDPVPLLFMLIGTSWGYFIHANLRWRFGWLSLLISTPAFHHWHHTNDEHVDKNYASMLPIMDILFGSWYMPTRQWPPKYGIGTPMAPDLFGELVHPFLPQRESTQGRGIESAENLFALPAHPSQTSTSPERRELKDEGGLYPEGVAATATGRGASEGRTNSAGQM
jgi:sterol desaturase/sphingolipid hydroxylase (fatty acid hydroxylase superfamily)